jgi:hypothetical protein
MVAIALTGMRVSAMAPTMNPIPDVIVGDSDGVSGTNEFVFPDALNLDNYASDPDSGPGPLTWSYEGTDAKYVFNGVAGLGGADDPVSPGAKSINDQVLQSEQNPDTDAATVTIRNQDLTPFGGPNVDPGPAGIVASETRVITLYVSDGATIAQRDIVVYSDNEGEDALSSGETDVVADDFSGGPGDWTYSNPLAIGGTVTSSSSNALCITVSAAGVNDAQWASTYPLFSLTNGAVYIGRFTFNTSQTTVGNVPLALIHIENESSVAFEAGSTYYSEFYFLDNFGGANSPDAQRMVLFTPPPVTVAEWQNGAFTPANDAFNDARVRFRILDVENVGYVAESDSGQVCLDEYDINMVDVGSFVRGATLFDQQNLTSSNYQVSQFASNVSFSGGNVTITPQGGNYTNELVTVAPGDGVGDIAAGGAPIADEYPVAWDTDGMMYEMVVGLSAPDQTSEDSPVDTFRMGLDAPTQEMISLTQVTGGLDGIAMPNVGSAQLYRGFYAGNDHTLSADHQMLRPRFDFFCNELTGFSGAAANVNPGGLTVHGVTVYSVTY